LARLLRRRPGLRVPGAFDGFETAVRAVLGQQITVRGATTLGGRIASALGVPVETPHPALDRLFPPPGVIAAAGEDRLARLGLPRARARTIVELARAHAAGRLVLDRTIDVAAALESLRAIPGIGDWTAEYLAGARTTFDLPLSLDGTPFQSAVWSALLEIPCGETRSYAALARRIGKPKAVRAVGLANGRNPIAIIVPCHRVIGADGALRGYGGGEDKKRWLLAHERRQLPLLDAPR